MTTIAINLGDTLKAGFELYKRNFWLLVLANLVAMVLASLTAGILAGPLTAGVVIVTLAALDGREPEPTVGEVFKGFEVFLPAFLYVIILMAISILANLLIPGLSIVVTYVLSTLTFFTIFFIAEDRMDFWPAIVRSYNIVKDNFFVFFLIVLVAGLISSAGFILCCIGMIFTAPFYYCVLAVVYRQHFPLGSITDANSVAVEVNEAEIVVEEEVEAPQEEVEEGEQSEEKPGE